jgi:hypothetical protein
MPFFDGPVTVEMLLKILQDLVAKNPEAKTWEVTHVEFGAYTPSDSVQVNEEEKFVCVG